MSSEIYNTEYFPSKDIEQDNFGYEARKISPYLFANNYWKETTIGNSMAYLKASTIDMIIWGGIYWDEVPRTADGYATFKEFNDYTSIEPQIQLVYFAEQSTLDQYDEEDLFFFLQLNIFPSPMKQTLPLNR